jgi:cell division protein FtsB
MKKLKNICLRIFRIKALKYVLVTIFAIVLIGFVDENSAWHHMKNKQRIAELEEEINLQNEQHKRNQTRIREIDRDPKAMEKIARERYFMKADDEDIFVLSDDNEKEQPQTSHETVE